MCCLLTIQPGWKQQKECTSTTGDVVQKQDAGCRKFLCKTSGKILRL